MDDDAFVTVAVVYSQPETAVILSKFDYYYGLLAFAVGQRSVSTLPGYLVAFQGIEIRVAGPDVADARAILAEATELPPVIRPTVTGSLWRDALLALVLFLFNAGPMPPRIASRYLVPR